MSSRHATDEAAELVTQAVRVARERGKVSSDRLAALESFLVQYYRYVSHNDLDGRAPEDLYGAAASHLEFAEQRTPGTALVRVFTPSAEADGWQCGHTVVEVVTDDMPFLVDSVGAELSRHGLGIHLVIHPQLNVRRDAVGHLLSLGGLGDGSLAKPDGGFDGTASESFIHLEVDRVPDQATATSLRTDIRRVLEDVRAAVEDWGKMAARVTESMVELDLAKPSGGDPMEIAEARDLLAWMLEDAFTFLGYREYELTTEGAVPDARGPSVESDQLVLRSIPGTGLGILRDAGLAPASRSFAELPPEVRERATDAHPLIVTKANSRATVHRPAYLDYIGVKRFDDQGRACGERRFLGLFASAAYRAPVMSVPVVRRKVSAVQERAGFAAGSHDAKDLGQILDGYPRDELLQISEDELFDTAIGILQLQERRRVRLFARYDAYGRYASCLVFLPRERYTTQVRLRLEKLLLTAFDGVSVDYNARVSESVLARLHFVVRTEPTHRHVVDLHELEDKLAAATRSWDDELADAIVEACGEDHAGALLARYGDSFPEGYKEEFPARSAVLDLLRLEGLRGPEQLDLCLYRPPGGAADERRFKVFRTGPPLSLSDLVPLLQDMGVEVTDERPYGLERADGDGGADAWVYDFGLHFTGANVAGPDRDALRVAFQDCFAAVWRGLAESDSFNALVLRAGLTWRQVSVLRGYARYLRQAGTTFSEAYLADALVRNPVVTCLLVELFESRFDPAREQDRADADVEGLVSGVGIALDDVASLDEDRILRSYLALVLATTRTNHFQVASDGAPKPHLSFKLDPFQVPDLPLPKPRYEIFVCSPRVEGVHLRFGAVARGGLRWSDRREDFRTEVLGLVKAQMVKNAVIVPVGSKGGFVVKRPGDPANREAVLAEGVACYQTLIRGLLDITDNIVDGEVVSPRDVVRHDGDDPYLVVAADKGTATFSDIANGVAAEYGYWLGDAFASGGSAGYDHKDMGITARGAWESVERHFREDGIDIAEQSFTVVGVGDMSGDVFGNGMLLSDQICLVGAFDHRHIFLDPDPDPAASLIERRRLYDLPRSSWDDYDRSQISPGGGVFPRSAKAIPVSPEMRAVLGVTDEVLTPAGLMRAILLAPVDLLWNGGIGTYVKSSQETHAEVGDKANDGIRVDGRALRAKVVGEGGNLGCTQRGRIEYALAGGRINTDAIDNSAGVDTSDHEVNIKILLDQAVVAGDLTVKQRNEQLAAMTDEVAGLVLRDNYEQNIALGNARAQAHEMLPVHQRYLSRLVADGDLDRAIEFLPDDVVIAERAAAGIGLTSPEFAVLLAYTKIVLTHQITNSDLPEDPYLSLELARYFPAPLRERFAGQMLTHRLRREIIATAVSNRIVNTAGITFVYRMAEETASSIPDIVRAHSVAAEVFAMPAVWCDVEALDNKVPTAVQTRVLLESRRLVERATRWLLHHRRPPVDIVATIEVFAGGVAAVATALPELLTGVERTALLTQSEGLVSLGIPADLAIRTAAFTTAYSGLDIVEVAAMTGVGVAEVAAAYFALDEALNFGWLRERIVALPRDDRWQTLARAALRDDLYSAHAALTADLLATTPPAASPVERIETWRSLNAASVGRATAMLADIGRGDVYDLATLSVALRQVRGLIPTSAS